MAYKSRIYKEGQGKIARGIMVAVIMIGSIFALVQLHGAIGDRGDLSVPLLNWNLDYRFLIHGPLLIGAAALSLWLFNRPATADFLIDTESELKNKVTWPSQREEVTASIVVVVTVLLLSLLIFGFDNLLKLVQRLVYAG